RRTEILAEEADGPDAVARREVEQDRQHHRVQMHVQMAVDVRETKPGRRESLELRLDLAAQLAAPRARDARPRVADAGRDRSVPEAAGGGHEGRDLRGTGGGPSLREDE